MKYNVGDKIKIKTWGDISEQCGGYIFPSVKKKIDELFPDRILTIKKVHPHFDSHVYTVEGIIDIRFSVDNPMIECLVERDTSLFINSRFDILDL